MFILLVCPVIPKTIRLACLFINGAVNFLVHLEFFSPDPVEYKTFGFNFNGERRYKFEDLASDSGIYFLFQALLGILLVLIFSIYFLLQELQELHSALEEAKADIVGLWALRFLTLQVG